MSGPKGSAKLHITGVILAFISFLPVLLNFELVPQNSLLQNSLQNSFLVAMTFAGTIASTAPLMVDSILDIWAKESDSQLYLFDRLVVLLSMIVPSVVFFVLRAHNYSHFGQVFTSVMVAQKIFFGAPLCSIICTSSSKIFSENTMLVLMLGFCVGQVMIQYWTLPGPFGQFAFASVWIIMGLSSGYFGYTLFQYWKYLKQFPAVPSEEYIVIVFLGMTLLFNVSLVLIFTMGGIRDYADFDVGILSYSNFWYVIVATTSTILPGRLARANVIQSKNMIQLKQSFVRYISHEIRTPMNISNVGISLLEDNLQAEGALRGENKDLVTQVKDAINLATEILNDLLTYEKLTSNLMVLEKKLEPPLEFVRSCLTMFEIQARANNVQFKIEAPDIPLSRLATLRVDVDKYKLGQVMRNLASNALKFTPSGGSITVTVLPLQSTDERSPLRQRLVGSFRANFMGMLQNPAEVSPVTDWIRVEVTDTGAGIDPSNLHKVFNEIIQFNANELQAGKGSGLGLYISKGIVDLHGGRVSVRSPGLGKGCTFCVDLPLIELPVELSKSLPVSTSPCEAHDRTAPSPFPGVTRLEVEDIDNHSVSIPVLEPTAVDASVKTTSLFAKRILVVDDSTVSRKMVVLMLKKHGVICVEAADGQQALDLIKHSLVSNPTPSLRSSSAWADVSSASFDIVIMDNMMPVMNGPDACRLMREAGYTNPIVGLTGHALESDRSAFMTSGATEVFTKPMNTGEFINYLKLIC